MKKFNRKTLKIGSFTLISTAIVLAILVFINLFISELPARFTSFDTTSQKLYSVGETSSELLGTIEDDIDIFFISTEGNETDTTMQVEQYILKYTDLNSHIKYTKIDPTLQPTFTQKYTEETVSENSAIVVCGNAVKIIDGDEWFLYETDYGQMSPAMYQSYAMYGYVDGSDPLLFYGEMKLTGALSYVTSDDIPVVYFTTGHSESELDSTFAGYIENENMTSASCSLITGDGKVPADCDILFINMPQTDFTEAEAEAVKDYYLNGGDVLLVTYCGQYSTSTHPNLTTLCKAMGLEPTDGIIIEGSPENYMQYPYCLVPNAGTEGPLAKLSNYTYITAYAHGIKAVDGTGSTVTELLTTSDKSFIKKDIENLSTYEKEDGDEDGPFCTAAVSSLASEESSADFVWFASPCITDSNYDMGGGNSALFTSCLNYMCNKETNVSILGVEMSTDGLTVTEADAGLLGPVFTVVIPVAVLAVGFAVWFRRRRK